MIYILKNYEGYFKIGLTKSFESRIAQHNTANSTDLEIIKAIPTSNENDYKLETTLHRYFDHRHIKREWFDLSEDDINRAEEIVIQQDKVINNLKKMHNKFLI